MRDKELLLFRQMKQEDILHNVSFLTSNVHHNSYTQADLANIYFETIHRLLSFGCAHKVKGNLWHIYLTYLLVCHENPYSLFFENQPVLAQNQDKHLQSIAFHDFEIFRELFSFAFVELEKALGIESSMYAFLVDEIEVTKVNDIAANDTVTKSSEALEVLASSLAKAGTTAEFAQLLTTFYSKFGIGDFAFFKAFRIDDSKQSTLQLQPILEVAENTLEDLVGYHIQKEKLIANTDAFIKGNRANNCLLYGDAGTGKSSSIKGILNRYYDKGLRIIELSKHQFKQLPLLIELIRTRNYRFIIYMDDLSFEEFEIEYKYLKAVIEGGIENRPDNVLLYATSNRRHLIRESFADRSNDFREKHMNDTVQEKLSLVARFGITIYFGAPDKKEYEDIVLELARTHQLTLPEEELLLLAHRWEINHGGRSGRAATQFIDDLVGKHTRHN